MNKKRVVITGMGALTPIGNSVDEYWKNLLSGKSGAEPITKFDASLFKTKFACEVKNFDPLDNRSVSDLQKVLNANGYDLEIDGRLGGNTLDALRDAQSKRD